MRRLWKHHRTEHCPVKLSTDGLFSHPTCLHQHISLRCFCNLRKGFTRRHVGPFKVLETRRLLSNQVQPACFYEALWPHVQPFPCGLYTKSTGQQNNIYLARVIMSVSCWTKGSFSLAKQYISEPILCNMSSDHRASKWQKQELLESHCCLLNSCRLQLSSSTLNQS